MVCVSKNILLSQYSPEAGRLSTEGEVTSLICLPVQLQSCGHNPFRDSYLILPKQELGRLS